MTKHSGKGPLRSSKFRRARVRNFVFTVGPDRLSGGLISRTHLKRGIVVRELEIASPRWPRAFDGLRIGHFSDLHIGSVVPLQRGLEAVDLLAEARPDLVVCTGDVVDLHAVAVEPLFRAMHDIRAPLGTALVLGNHDLLDDPVRVAAMASDSGVTVLEDDTLELHAPQGVLRISGIGWAPSVRGCAARMQAAGAEAAHLLLSHNPKAFRHAMELGIPLTLSGHTHGGQIALPGRPQMSLALSHRYRAGLYQQALSRLFVTTGVGSWFPLRVNCPAEVVIVTMRHERPSESGAGAS